MESSIVPEIYDPGRVDQVVKVSTEDGWDMADRAAAEEGLHIGHSSGANIFAAVRLAEELHRKKQGGMRGHGGLRPGRSLFCTHEVGTALYLVTLADRGIPGLEASFENTRMDARRAAHQAECDGGH